MKVTKKYTVNVFIVKLWLPGNFRRNKSDVIESDSFDKSRITHLSKKSGIIILLQLGTQT